MLLLEGGRGPIGGYTAYSGDRGRPVRRDVGQPFRRKPAGAERRWAFGYLSHADGAVKPARVFRRDPPVSVC